MQIEVLLPHSLDISPSWFYSHTIHVLSVFQTHLLYMLVISNTSTQDLADLPLSNKGLEELSTHEVIGLLSYLDLDRFATEFKKERVSAILLQCRVWLVVVFSFLYYVRAYL